MRCQLPCALLLPLVLAGCSTPGGFLRSVDGAAFPGPRASDDAHALVYLYRPRSAWADQELEAPGLFLDNRLLGSYWTWLADGPRDFNRIASFALDAEGGGVYYLRYDELSLPPLSAGLANPGDGPLQLVNSDLALTEIAATREVQPLARIAASSERERPPARLLAPGRPGPGTDWHLAG